MVLCAVRLELLRLRLYAYSLFPASIVDPGRVTESYIRDYEQLFGYEELRICQKCNQKKPPRCHHCSICKVCLLLFSHSQMCVVNMDHHCPWLCNCIGYANKKFFVLFLLYAWLGCLDTTLSSYDIIMVFYPSSATTFKPLSVVA